MEDVLQTSTPDEKETNEKFELLLDQGIEFENRMVYPIRAKRDISTINWIVKKGDIGGYVEFEHNLNKYDESWIFEKATVIGTTSVVTGNAVIGSGAKVIRSTILKNATICDGATVRESTVSGQVYIGRNVSLIDCNVSDNAQIEGHIALSSCDIHDNAHIDLSDSKNLIWYSRATVGYNAWIMRPEHLMTMGPFGSRDGYLTIYRNCYGNLMAATGCFCSTLDEFEIEVEKKYRGAKTKKETDYCAQYTTAITAARTLWRHFTENGA